jgi:flagellar M-ring protein FliF
LVAPVPQPGAQSNAAGPANTHKENTVNFEIDKTIRHVKGEVGAVKRLSVAVVVNYRVTKEKKKPTALTEQEIGQINNLVREAMGYNKERGDTVNVVNAPFSGEQAEEVTSPWRSWIDRWLAPEGVIHVAKYLALALVLIYAWFGLLRPALRDIVRSSRRAQAEEALGEQEGLEGTAQMMAAANRGAEDPFAAEMLAAKELAKREPKVVAGILKDWLGT